MYLPKSRYKIKSTPGNEFKNEDGSNYIGRYVETADGRFFKGSSPAENLEEIFSNTSEEETNRIQIERPYNDYYGPTDEDYERGFFIRYFTKDKRNGTFTELGREQWKEKRQLSYVTSGQIEWLLKGPVFDGQINNIPYKGTSTKNLERLEELEKEFPGLKRFFFHTEKFVK